jgi:hypothetical protein
LRKEGGTYSEKTDAREVAFERSGEWPDPLESNPQPDDLGLRIITETIDYGAAGGKSRLVGQIANKEATTTLSSAACDRP